MTEVRGAALHFPVLIACLLWQLAPVAPSPHAGPGVGWPIRSRSW